MIRRILALVGLLVFILVGLVLVELDSIDEDRYVLGCEEWYAQPTHASLSMKMLLCSKPLITLKAEHRYHEIIKEVD